MQSSSTNHATETILTHFSTLRDPRVKGRCDHPFVTVVGIAFVAILAGCNGWEEIEDFSKAGLKGITRIAVSPKGDRMAIVARGTQ